MRKWIQVNRSKSWHTEGREEDNEKQAWQDGETLPNIMGVSQWTG